MYVIIAIGFGSLACARPSTSCTSAWLSITMLQYYICLGIVLTVILVLVLGLGFGIINFYISWSVHELTACASRLIAQQSRQVYGARGLIAAAGWSSV